MMCTNTQKYHDKASALKISDKVRFLIDRNDVNRLYQAMDYFVKLQYPVYTRVWGENINSTITKEQKTESAFGGTIVDYVPVNHRELIITGASPTTYVYDKTNTLSGENVITEAEIEKVMADRNIYLETVKASSKAYYDSKKAQSNVSSAFNASTTMAVPEGDFASYFG